MIDSIKYPNLAKFSRMQNAQEQRGLLETLDCEEILELLKHPEFKVVKNYSREIVEPLSDTQKAEFLIQSGEKCDESLIYALIIETRNDLLKTKLMKYFISKLEDYHKIEIIVSVNDKSLRTEIIEEIKGSIKLSDILRGGIGNEDSSNDSKNTENQQLIKIEDFQRFTDGYFNGNAYQEKKHCNNLNLPPEMTIGIELEFNNLSYYILNKANETGLLDVICKSCGIPIDIVKKWNIKKEYSVVGGAEVTSPILTDQKENWEQLDMICYLLKKMGAMTNSSCGGHIHIGFNVLGVSDKAWKNLLFIWGEAESLLYKMCNKEGEKLRESVLTYAWPISNSIYNLYSMNKILSVNIEKKEDLQELIKELNIGKQHARKYVNEFKSCNVSN